MRHRTVRLAVWTMAAMAFALSSPSDVIGLTCARHADVERAAREALTGDHPSWAAAYIVGRVEAIERPLHAPLVLTVTLTHIFDGDLADRVRLAARSDGPPDPASWQIGGHYFLALQGAPELEGVAGLVAPCAPNFRITAPDQLDQLIGAAPAVEVREGAVQISAGSEWPAGTAVVLGAAAAVIGLGSWLAFRRDLRKHHRA
jgi:hypothetical protein